MREHRGDVLLCCKGDNGGICFLCRLLLRAAAEEKRGVHQILLRNKYGRCTAHNLFKSTVEGTNGIKTAVHRNLRDAFAAAGQLLRCLRYTGDIQVSNVVNTGLLPENARKVAGTEVQLLCGISQRQIFCIMFSDITLQLQNAVLQIRSGS